MEATKKIIKILKESSTKTSFGGLHECRVICEDDFEKIAKKIHDEYHKKGCSTSLEVS